MKPMFQTSHRNNIIRPTVFALSLGSLTLLGLLATGCSSGSASVTTTAASTVRAITNFSTIDGPGGGNTTINGISPTGAAVGFTTNNGVNANFLFRQDYVCL